MIPGRLASPALVAALALASFLVTSLRHLDETARRFSSWLSRHDAQLIGRIEDPTYGLMEIFRVKLSR